MKLVYKTMMMISITDNDDDKYHLLCYVTDKQMSTKSCNLYIENQGCQISVGVKMRSFKLG